MAKIVYRQMPTPRELSLQIPAHSAKARMQKPQGGRTFLVQIPGGTWRGVVIDEIDTCIIILYSCVSIVVTSIIADDGF